jgi:hypothetical protein
MAKARAAVVSEYLILLKSFVVLFVIEVTGRCMSVGELKQERMRLSRPAGTV